MHCPSLPSTHLEPTTQVVNAQHSGTLGTIFGLIHLPHPFLSSLHTIPNPQRIVTQEQGFGVTSVFTHFPHSPFFSLQTNPGAHRIVLHAHPTGGNVGPGVGFEQSPLLTNLNGEPGSLQLFAELNVHLFPKVFSSPVTVLFAQIGSNSRVQILEHVGLGVVVVFSHAPLPTKVNGEPGSLQVFAALKKHLLLNVFNSPVTDFAQTGANSKVQNRGHSFGLGTGIGDAVIGTHFPQPFRSVRQVVPEIQRITKHEGQLGGDGGSGVRGVAGLHLTTL